MLGCKLKRLLFIVFGAWWVQQRLDSLTVISSQTTTRTAQNFFSQKSLSLLLPYNRIFLCSSRCVQFYVFVKAQIILIWMNSSWFLNMALDWSSIWWEWSSLQNLKKWNWVLIIGPDCDSPSARSSIHHIWSGTQATLSSGVTWILMPEIICLPQHSYRAVFIRLTTEVNSWGSMFSQHTAEAYKTGSSTNLWAQHSTQDWSHCQVSLN